jgi:hypothetical protein
MFIRHEIDDTLYFDQNRGRHTNGLLSTLRRLLPSGNFDPGELGFKLGKKRLGHFFRCALAFDPIAALVVFGVLFRWSQTGCHRKGVDGVLNFPGELFFDRASIPFDNKIDWDVPPVRNALF